MSPSCGSPARWVPVSAWRSSHATQLRHRPGALRGLAEDRILPFEATAGRLSELIADVTVVPLEGGSHNIGWTHSEEVNASLLNFLTRTKSAA